MKILAIETSSLVASVAILEDQTILGEYNLNNTKNHSTKIMPMIKELLDSLKLKINEIDLFAVSIGPGSFTGLRIGVSTVKTFCYALDKPVVGVNTLDSLCFNVKSIDKLVCPIIDARNNQVYTSLYKNNVRLIDYFGIEIEELTKIINEYKEEVIFVGDGINIYKNYFTENINSTCQFESNNFSFPKAVSCALLAFEKYKNNEATSFNELLPFYLRKSQAERLRKI